MIHCQSIAIVDSSAIILSYFLFCAFDQSFVLMSQLKQIFELVYFLDTLRLSDLILCTILVYAFLTLKLNSYF